MWDIIKKAAGVVLERGAEYVVQAAAVQSILSSPDFDSGVAALREHIYGLESETSFNTFLAVVQNRYNEAVRGVEQARHDEAGSWGNSVEDRMAQSMAYLKAGVPQGQSAAVQEAERFVEVMIAMDKYARQFWQDAQASRLAEQIIPPIEPTASQRDEAPQPTAGESLAAFSKHLAQFSGTATTEPLIEAPSSGPLTEMEALSLQLQADGQITRLMMATMPGQATEEIVEQLDETHALYARLLRGIPEGSTLVTRENVVTGLARAREFAGNACDSMREEARAVAYYEEALTHLQSTGDDVNAAKLQAKIAVLREHMTGDIDAAIQRLSEPKGEFLEEMNRLLDLASVTQQGGDSYKALELLHKVETSLKENEITPPAPDSLATDLMQSMADLQSGAAVAGGTLIERDVKIRGIFQSLYGMLAKVYGATDPDHPDFETDAAKSDAYHKKWEAMDSRSDNEVFSNMMRQFLDQGKLG